MEFLRRHGSHPRGVLGSGMEGAVIDLGDNRVAKIWHTRTAGELEVLRSFYEAVAGAVLPFQTPRIRAILSFEGRSATVENMMRGRPLRAGTGSGTASPVVSDAEAACITDVLTSLADVGVTAEMGVLPPLEGEPPFPTETTPFTHSLADLVERRVQSFVGPCWPGATHSITSPKRSSVGCER